MEKRHGMPVWAPSNEEMNQIARQVSAERGKVAAELAAAVRSMFAGAREPVTAKEVTAAN